MFAQPHHEGILSGVTQASGISTRPSLRGPLRGYEGKEWVITQPLHDVSFYSQTNVPDQYLGNLREALADDAENIDLDN